MTTEKKEHHNHDVENQDSHMEESCCGGHRDTKDTESKEATSSRSGIVMKSLVTVLGIAVIANVFFLGKFVFSVGGKLDEAVELTKSQKVSLVMISPENCTVCRDVSVQKNYILEQNVEVLDDKIVPMNSTEGKKLIEDYNITTLPALVLVSEENIKSNLAKAFEKGSHKEGDKAFVWESALPPFVNSQSGNIEGLVSITYLTDTSCSTCYDVEKVQTPILQQFGIVPASAKRIDVSEKEGQDLVKKYSITKVPTVLLSSGVSAYTALAGVWNQVGTVENDGTYIFRTMEAIQSTYRDLNTNKIIETKADTAS